MILLDHRLELQEGCAHILRDLWHFSFRCLFDRDVLHHVDELAKQPRDSVCLPNSILDSFWFCHLSPFCVFDFRECAAVANARHVNDRHFNRIAREAQDLSSQLFRQHIVTPHLPNDGPVARESGEVARKDLCPYRIVVDAYLDRVGFGLLIRHPPGYAPDTRCVRVVHEANGAEALAVGCFLEALDVGLDVRQRGVEIKEIAVLVRLARVEKPRDKALLFPLSFRVHDGQRRKNIDSRHSFTSAGRFAHLQCGCAGACVCPLGKG